MLSIIQNLIGHVEAESIIRAENKVLKVVQDRSPSLIETVGRE